LNKSNKSGVILSAAMADITICEIFGYLPTGLIPINGKPIIFFILQQFIDNNILNIYIGVDYKKEKLQKVVDTYFKDKLTIHYVLTNKEEGAGNSLHKVLQKVSTEEVIVNLADTYIKDLNLRQLKDEIIVSDDFIDECKWATVNILDDKIVKFQEKKTSNSKDNLAICGVYSFLDISIFQKFDIKTNKLEISSLLMFYLGYKGKLDFTLNDNWLDFGHIDNYYTSKKELIQSRSFNTLQYDSLLGTITKRSKNIDKFKDEIKWQLELPKNIQVLSPRILDYSLDSDLFVTMEFYSYPTLSEIWIFSELNEKVYFSIIDKLFKVLELFQKNKYEVSIDSYYDMYLIKTKNRINMIENNIISNLLNYENVSINNKLLSNWNNLERNLKSKIKLLYKEEDNCFLHGDFCLSNILYDLPNGLLRLIDPRGKWGEDKYGDIKYDIAKLRHSICGDYDYIVNDLFSISHSNNTITYTVYNSGNDNIKKYFDGKLSCNYLLNDIKLIEGLLFLSMIPLHSDNKNRQLLMYAKAIELLNEI